MRKVGHYIPVFRIDRIELLFTAHLLVSYLLIGTEAEFTQSRDHSAVTVKVGVALINKAIRSVQVMWWTLVRAYNPMSLG